ncbi:permease-like cell division protein FtsX [Microbacterium sp. ZXX196]|uniref:permease-like cell division protein FtsX n=1 Tax=Microbacterium sp. ZXX196 TaxID=2609291 RepID=UPI0012B9F68C|nr:permease-like cell division protein FtsX [Microbacterium sp. ZXX196]MTE24422.1 FtsX-like permease family protein [Microbacterium sp. ZXX196]
MNPSLILSEAFQGLRRNASMVVSVVLVTFVSLTFVGAAVLMQAQIAKTNDYFTDRAQVDVYMCSSISTVDTCVDGVATDEQIDEVRDRLEGSTLSPMIESVEFESQQEAHDALVEAFDEDLAGLLTVDQTSAVFHINLVNPDETAVIRESFAGEQGVEEVADQLEYLDPLFSTLTIATYIAVGIAVLMLVSAVLLISTTIRLSAFARRREVGIMRLVGASNGTIQTPFVLEGVLAAFLGAALASATVLVAVRFGVQEYLAREAGAIPWIDLADAWLVVPIVVGLGVVLAALSAGVAIRRWLRE